MIQKVGILIWKELAENNRLQKELCRGVCSQSELSKILMGIKVPDYFLLVRIIERLGRTNKYFEYMLSQKEYDLYKLRYEIYQCIQEKNYKAVEQKLHQYEKSCKKKVLHKQYIDSIRAILLFEKGEFEKGFLYLKQSIQYTLGNRFQEELIQRKLIGKEEMTLLLLYYKMRYEWIEEEQEESLKMIEEIADYVKEYCRDHEIKGILYAKVGFVLGSIYYEREQYEKAVEICELSLEAMQESGWIPYMMQILSIIVSSYDRLGIRGEEQEILEKERKCLKEVYREFQILYQNEYLIGMDFVEVFLDWDLLKMLRQSNALSQEKIASQTYCQESISRIETQKRKVNHKKFQQLLQEMGIPYELYFNPFIQNNFNLIEAKKQFENKSVRGDKNKMEAMLLEFKKIYEEDNIYNKQYFCLQENIINIGLKRIDEKEALSKFLECLYLTKPSDCDPFDGHLTRQEVWILSNIAISYKKIGEFDKAIQIWKQILEYYKMREVDEIFFNSTIGAICYNLGKTLEEHPNDPNLEEAYNLCQRGIKLDIKTGRGDILGMYLSEVADIFYKQNKIEQSRKYYKYAYWMLYLMKSNRHTRVLNKAYKNKYKSDIKSEEV